MLAALAWSAGVQAAEDGQRAFRKCISCHSIDKAERGLPGPNLHGIAGRPAGQDRGFEYSPALLAAARRGLVWDDGALDAYIAAPEDFLPGTAMSFHGIADGAERAVLIGYLKAAR